MTNLVSDFLRQRDGARSPPDFALSQRVRAAGHVRFAGDGTSKTVTVVLSITSAQPVQHTVSLSWQIPSGKVVRYSMYRSTIEAGSYGMLASAIGGTSYIDQTVQSGNPYYYVITTS